MQKFGSEHETSSGFEEAIVLNCQRLVGLAGPLEELGDPELPKMRALPELSTAIQNFALAHEIDVTPRPLSINSGADQLLPSYATTSPASSPATQKVELAHDRESRTPFASITEGDSDQKVPL
jgi:hypothetical protein